MVLLKSLLMCNDSLCSLLEISLFRCDISIEFVFLFDCLQFVRYSDFLTYKTGIYKHVSGGYVGGHAVKVKFYPFYLYKHRHTQISSFPFTKQIDFVHISIFLTDWYHCFFVLFFRSLVGVLKMM